MPAVRGSGSSGSSGSATPPGRSPGPAYTMIDSVVRAVHCCRLASTAAMSARAWPAGTNRFCPALCMLPSSSCRVGTRGPRDVNSPAGLGATAASLHPTAATQAATAQAGPRACCSLGWRATTAWLANRMDQSMLRQWGRDSRVQDILVAAVNWAHRQGQDGRCCTCAHVNATPAALPRPPEHEQARQQQVVWQPLQRGALLQVQGLEPREPHHRWRQRHEAEAFRDGQHPQLLQRRQCRQVDGLQLVCGMGGRGLDQSSRQGRELPDE